MDEFDLGRLPKNPERWKIVVKDEPGWSGGGILFGTQVIASREQGRVMQVERERARNAHEQPKCETAVQINAPDLISTLQNNGWHTDHAFPADWTFRRHSWDDYWSFSRVIICYLQVPHGFKWPKGVPPEVGCLLAGHLQRNQELGWLEYQRYLSLEGLKFLPFVITPTHYRFFVWNPTQEQVLQAEKTFQEVLQRIKSMRKKLLQQVILTYSLIRMDEVGLLLGRTSLNHHSPARRQVSLASGAIGDVLGRPQFRRQEYVWGFVYQAMPGSQDAARFEPHMFSRE